MLSQEQFKTQVYKKFTFEPVSLVVQGKMMGVNQWFGENNVGYYSKFGWKGHNALDIASDIGDLCYAPINCEVIKVVHDPEKDGQLGEHVLAKTKEFVLDGETYFIELQWYHIHKSLVVTGQQLKAKDKVAETGNTGQYTTGPHLHFQTRPMIKSGNKWVKAFPNNGYDGAIDPYPFFRANDFFGRPPGEPKLIPGALVKSKEGPHPERVYYVKEKEELYWIENEKTFNAGHALGWWGTWTDIIQVSAQLDSEHSINIV